MTNFDVELLVQDFVLKNKENVNKNIETILSCTFEMLSLEYAHCLDQDTHNFVYTNKKYLINFEDFTRRNYLRFESSIHMNHYAEMDDPYSNILVKFYDAVNYCVLFYNSNDAYNYVADYLFVLYELMSYRDYTEIDYDFMKDLCDEIKDRIQ